MGELELFGLKKWGNWADPLAFGHDEELLEGGDSEFNEAMGLLFGDWVEVACVREGLFG